MTDVTLSLEATTGSALADLGACDNIIEVESGKTYEHAAGTQWYKFTGDLFENEGLFSRVRLVNRSAETDANIDAFTKVKAQLDELELISVTSDEVDRIRVVSKKKYEELKSKDELDERTLYHILE